MFSDTLLSENTKGTSFMKVYKTKDIRNIALIGHGGSGKTLLAEALAYNAGLIERMGRPEDGSTISDYDASEQAKGSSISTSLIPIEHKNTKINVLDVPGYFDYIGEECSALRVADAALIVVDALSGVQVGTEKAYEMAVERGVPVAFVVNKIDRENVEFEKTLSQLQELADGGSLVPFQLPLNPGVGFNSIAGVFDNKSYTYTNGKAQVADTDAIADEAEEYRDTIFEEAASTDDDLMEMFFEADEGTLTEKDMHAGIKNAIAQGSLYPLFCVSALSNVGIDKLMDNIVDYMPDPIEAKENTSVDLDEGDKTYEDDTFSAFVFKTIADPFVGKISLFKVMSGKLTPGIEVINTTQNKKEKLAKLFTMCGKKQVELPEIEAGDIGALAKLTYTKTSDTLADPKAPVQYHTIRFPQSIIFTGIEPKSRGDEDKLSTGLAKLREEDPTIIIKRDDETHQNVLYGMGETHLDIVKDKLKKKFGIEVVLTDPIIPYRETIKGKATAEGKHKKQSGGRGQFGVVNITYEPTNDLSEGLEFVDAVVGGAVPRNFIPAVEKGLNECIQHGVLAGYPVVGLKATLFDGKFHPVDSDEMSFKMAASISYKAGLAEANPVLLEPIYSVKITIPNDYTGDVMGDLNKKRGRVMGMDPAGKGKTVLSAEVPLGEMFKYATELRSMTQARGSFTMEFERYDEVPHNASEKIIEEAKKREEAKKK